MRRTKIIATLGPAIDSAEKLCELVEAGANLFRINTAHGDWETRRQWIQWIRDAEQTYKIPLGVLLDLAGPKIRIGNLRAPMELRAGEQACFTLSEQQTDSAIPLPVAECFARRVWATACCWTMAQSNCRLRAWTPSG
jgi:Pyruvate kinase